MIIPKNPLAVVKILNQKLYPRLLSGVAPYYIVNEFPKSGGTWLSNILSDALEIPFRRRQYYRFENSIVHGHYLSPRGLRNVICLWRDPRDIFVSYYYHCFFKNEGRNHRLVELMRARLPFDDFADIHSNMPEFIRSLHEDRITPSFTWSEFAGVWVDRPGVHHTHYAALRNDGPAELARIVQALSGRTLSETRAAEVYEGRSFARAKAAAEERLAQTPKAQVAFVREGAVGGWRKHFSDEAETLVERYCGPMMTRLGYG